MEIKIEFHKDEWDIDSSIMEDTIKFFKQNFFNLGLISDPILPGDPLIWRFGFIKKQSDIRKELQIRRNKLNRQISSLKKVELEKN